MTSNIDFSCYDFGLNHEKKHKFINLLDKFVSVDTYLEIDDVLADKISIKRNNSFIVNKCKTQLEVINFLSSITKSDSTCSFVRMENYQVVERHTSVVKDKKYFYDELITQKERTSYAADEKMMTVYIDNAGFKKSSSFFAKFPNKIIAKKEYASLNVDDKLIQTNIQFGCGALLPFHLDEYSFGTVSLLDEFLSPGIVKIWILFVNKFTIRQKKFMFTQLENLELHEIVNFLLQLSSDDFDQIRVVYQFPGDVIEIPSNVEHVVITGINSEINKLGMNVLSGIFNCTNIQGILSCISNPIRKISQINEIANEIVKIKRILPDFEEKFSEQIKKYEKKSLISITGHNNRKKKQKYDNRDQHGKFARV